MNDEHRSKSYTAGTGTPNYYYGQATATTLLAIRTTIVYILAMLNIGLLSFNLHRQKSSHHKVILLENGI